MFLDARKAENSGRQTAANGGTRTRSTKGLRTSFSSTARIVLSASSEIGVSDLAQTKPAELQVFERSYSEVLLFLKHQDDKINRVLTALAFLTAAGVALYVFGRANPPLAFPKFADSAITADDYFFGAFLIGLFFAVSFSLVALDPTSYAPRFLDASEGSTSVLYYRAIHAMGKADWDSALQTASIEGLTTTFHDDARRLSHRAIHKVRRFGQANAWVQFTVVALAALGLMRLTNLSIDDKWRATTALLTVYTVLPLVDFAYLRGLNFPGVGSENSGWLKSRSKKAMWVLVPFLFYVPFIAVAVVYLWSRQADWAPVTIALFGVVVLRLLALFEWKKLGWYQWVPPVTGSLAMATAAALGLWVLT